MAQQPPTILFLASWYPVPNNKSHGIFIQNHALALSRFCKVIVAYAYTSFDATNTTLTKTLVNPNFEEWRVAYPKTTVSLPGVAAFLKLQRFKRAYGLLLKELVKENINVKAIQLNTVFPAAMSLPLFKNYYKVPHTIVEHWSGYLPEDGNYKDRLTKHYTKQAVASASKIFYVSEKQKQAMQQHGLLGEYELIYNVVDTAVFHPQNTGKPARPLLLHVSSLDDAQKNVSGILNVVQALQKQHADFELVCIGGNTALVEAFTQRAKTLALNNVSFLGQKPPAEIAAYMNKATAFVLFSNYENMPVVILEAMACGLPVISTRVGYLDHLVQPGFGLLININDEAALQQSLKQVLHKEVNFDKEKMSQFVAEHASPQVVGQQLYNFYKALLASS